MMDVPTLARRIAPIVIQWAEDNDLETSTAMECELAKLIAEELVDG